MPMKYPPHPGRSILRDCMEPLGMSLSETAKKLGVSPEELSSVINGESAITFALAIRLDNLFGGGASTWYQLQAQYDEAQERNKNDLPKEPESFEIHQQTAIHHLEHGQVVYKSYDAEVIALLVVSDDEPKIPSSSSRQKVEFRFVGEGAGVVQIQMIYQPSSADTPQLVADILLKTYLEWNAESDEYVGHIDSAEWNREFQKLYAGKETMNALYAGLWDHHSVPALDAENAVESDPEYYAVVLQEAEALLYKGTASVLASAFSGV
jgi:addiction module HigA family antidote